MNTTKPQYEKTDDAPVVSPLVNDKTYGERWYSRIFDWGLNYWANLLTSAGFSQWAENGNGVFKIPFTKTFTTPREMQKSLAEGIQTKDPLMTGRIPFTNARIPFFKGFVANAEELAKEKIASAEAASGSERQLKMASENVKLDVESVKKLIIEDRAMARARSLTLLVPGFLIVVPTVWLGAKIKPWFVNKLDQHKYGVEAMDDPTLKARHAAIAAEARPTFLGAIAARLITMVAVQATAQAVGSEGNFVNRLGKNHDALKNFGVNEVTEKVGSAVGSALPKKAQERFDTYARKHGLDWSEGQITKHLKDAGHLPEYHVGQLKQEMQDLAKKEMGPYSKATQDLGRFIATDTFYTMVTALTIHPAVKLLRKIPGMSYKPKGAEQAQTTVLMPMKVRVPSNQYGEFPDGAQPATSQNAADIPSLSISQPSAQGTLQHREHQIA